MRYIKNNPFLWSIIFVFSVAWYISTFWFQIMFLQGNSMEPAFHSGQFLIVDKHSEFFDRGDVIMIKKGNMDGFLVKRIVAVPGDSVYIDNKTLYINGESQEEWNGRVDFAGIAEHPIVLGENRYFVLGDNPEVSKDSRYEEIGLIERREIKGKIVQ